MQNRELERKSEVASSNKLFGGRTSDHSQISFFLFFLSFILVMFADRIPEVVNKKILAESVRKRKFK